MNKEIVLRKLNNIFSETGTSVGMTQKDRAVELILAAYSSYYCAAYHYVRDESTSGRACEATGDEYMLGFRNLLTNEDWFVETYIKRWVYLVARYDAADRYVEAC